MMVYVIVFVFRLTPSYMLFMMVYVIVFVFRLTPPYMLIMMVYVITFVFRLTPPYMLIMMVYVSLFPYIGEGPGWLKDGAETDYCIHSWHRNLLYVNNLFVDGYDMVSSK
jgi:hypothetical protein